MGAIYIATCHCHFQQNITVGGDQANYHRRSFFPFLCKQCGLVEVNICKRRLRCPKCSSSRVQAYGSPKLSPHDIGDRELSWDGYSAGSLRHFCPSCKQHHLSFELSYLFD
jgi:hypothetical protein